MSLSILTSQFDVSAATLWAKAAVSIVDDVVVFVCKVDIVVVVEEDVEALSASLEPNEEAAFTMGFLTVSIGSLRLLLVVVEAFALPVLLPKPCGRAGKFV